MYLITMDKCTDISFYTYIRRAGDLGFRHHVYQRNKNNSEIHEANIDNRGIIRKTESEI